MCEIFSLNSGENSKNNTLPVTPNIEFAKPSKQINPFDLKQNLFENNLNNEILFFENENDDLSANGNNSSIFDQKFNFPEEFYLNEEDNQKKWIVESNNLNGYNY